MGLSQETGLGERPSSLPCKDVPQSTMLCSLTQLLLHCTGKPHSQTHIALLRGEQGSPFLTVIVHFPSNEPVAPHHPCVPGPSESHLLAVGI